MLNRLHIIGFASLLALYFLTGCFQGVVEDQSQIHTSTSSLQEELTGTSTPLPSPQTKKTDTPKPDSTPAITMGSTEFITPIIENTFQGTIAFITDSQVYDPITVLNLENATIENFSKSGVSTLSWSSEGNWLAFDGNVPPSRDINIYKIKANGTDLKQLTNSHQEKSDVAWSPVSNTILYAYSNDGHPYDLAFVDGNNGLSQLLTSTNGSERYPTWSPNEKHIAYLYIPYPNWPAELWIMDTDGKNSKRLIKSRIVVGRIDWSRDGDWIAFVSQGTSSGCGDVFIVKPDGSNLQSFTNSSICATAVVWSPDSKFIAFIGRNPDNNTAGNISDWGWEIYVMDIKSKNVVAVTSEKGWILRDLDWTSSDLVKN